MDNQLRRILQFAQTTGDKVIITDASGREPMVVMPFDMYEHLISVGRKNTDISGEIDSLEGIDDAPFVPPVPMHDDLALEVGPKPVEKVKEPVAKKEEKAPTLAKKEEDEDVPGEEQYYLEPVE